MSSPSNLRVAQPSHPLVLDTATAPAGTPPSATSAPAANAEPAPIAALDALALCAASGALGG